MFQPRFTHRILDWRVSHRNGSNHDVDKRHPLPVHQPFLESTRVKIAFAQGWMRRPECTGAMRGVRTLHAGKARQSTGKGGVMNDIFDSIAGPPARAAE